MEMYFLKSAACLAVLLLFYKLLLERENMHVFKRFYLLTSVVASIVIPTITFTTYVEPSTEVFAQVFNSSEGAPKNTPVNYLPQLLTGIYFLGVLFFSIKFIRNLRVLILKIRKNPKVRHNNIINVLLSEKIPPHTFFSYIFFNKQKYLRNQIPQDIKVHEEAHALQKHSLDVIFIELLQIVFWINPLIFLLKNAMKLNHEFLADRAVIQKGFSTSGYQQTLLSYSSGDLQCDLVNPINYSSIKKRFTVMKTRTSKNSILARSLLLLPLLALLLFGFSTKEVVAKEIDKPILQKEEQEKKDSSLSNNINITEIIDIKILKNGDLLLNNKTTSLKKLSVDIQSFSAQYERVSGKKISRAYIETHPETHMGIITDVKEILRNAAVSEIYFSLEGEQVSKIAGSHSYHKAGNLSQEKATPEMVNQYNSIARKYNSNQEQLPRVEMEDYKRMRHIYDRMSSEQKKVAENFPKVEIIEVVVDNGNNIEVVKDQDRSATPEMIAEYNRLVKHYNSIPKDKLNVKQEDINRIMSILSNMTQEQKAQAEKINFDVPPPPPPAPAPYPKNAPPPPPPPSYDSLVERGAVFYYNFKEIKPEEARILVEVEKKVNVHITDYDGKPVVRLTDKKKK